MKEAPSRTERSTVIQELTRMAAAEGNPRRRMPILRDRFVIQFVTDLGNRRRDLATALMGVHVVEKDGVFRCTFQTKNDTDDPPDLSSKCSRFLKEYMATRVEMGIHSVHLLVTQTGEPQAPNHMHAAISRRFLRIVGVSYSVQALRHAFFSDEIDRHGDLAKASATLGDSKKVARQFYDRILPQKYIAEYHDMARIYRDGGSVPLVSTRKLLDRCMTDPVLRTLVLNAIDNRKQQKNGGSK